MDIQPNPSFPPTGGFHGQIPGPPPANKSYTWMVIGVVALAVVLLVGAPLWMGITNLAASADSVTQVAENFLAITEAEQFDKAYSEIGAGWKNIQKQEDFRTMFVMVRQTLGKRSSMKLMNYAAKTDSKLGTVARAIYLARYERGEATLTVNLQQESGVWRVVGLNFNSPQLAKGTRCGKCNTVNPVNAKFCTQCGQAMAAPMP